MSVHLQETNIGDESQLFSSGNQKLLADGKEYDSALFASSGDTMETLNPGLGLDVPSGRVARPGALSAGCRLDKVALQLAHSALGSEGERKSAVHLVVCLQNNRLVRR